MIPFVIGGLAGISVLLLMRYAGMSRSRDGYAVVLVAIALFWPVFAAEAADWYAFAGQSAGLLLFTFIALKARVTGLFWLGAAIAGHGALDLGLAWADAPGPAWWPALCGGLDLVVGGTLMYQTRSETL